jgi:putative DNA-invertase from lambdoid prophage Rac
VPPYPPRGVRSYDKGVRAAAYVRVSSQGQDDGSQRAAIQRAAAARGDEVALWYAEKASATTNDRAALGALREAARAGAVRRLYVFRIDRLTRTGILDTFRLVEELRRHGCELVTVADGFDLQGPGAEITLAVMAWAAQMERAALSERLAASRARAKAAGKPWGRPPAHSDELAEKAVHLRVNEKRSIRKIAIALKVPRATVHRWCKAAELAPRDA